MPDPLFVLLLAVLAFTSIGISIVSLMIVVFMFGLTSADRFLAWVLMYVLSGLIVFVLYWLMRVVVKKSEREEAAARRLLKASRPELAESQQEEAICPRPHPAQPKKEPVNA